jgi:hypothetical protein
MAAMSGERRVSMLPVMAGLHLRYPRYNAVVVEELLDAERPEALALEPLPPDFGEDAAWRDGDELLLPWVAVPWAQRRGVPVVGVHEPSPDPGASDEFARYLSPYPGARAALDAVAAAERPLADLLEQALTLERVMTEVVPVLADSHRRRLEAFGDGPGTDWQEARAAAAAERVLAVPAERVTVLVALDRLVPLRDALESRGTRVATPSSPPVSDRARERALLDLAWRGESPEPGPLIAQLRQLGHAEALFHAANLLLAHGHVAEALETLESVMATEFAEPPFLPGLALARLGQLRDLAGQRERARRAYRGVLALSWAPRDARAAARAGLDTAFELPGDGAA